ncbi:PIN domain-containing protein [Caldilinea sp.]|uniref:PIN domain-containing protein n=1 Tax=Caldilinea sp. TaxID=2293560 RepID=UPI0031370D31|nr:PIN domain-containing protein [Anaerolineales bacterium]
MRILIDTNILLDVLLNREPWVAEAAMLWAACENGQATGYICASSFTDIFYIAHRLTDIEHARKAVRLCLGTFEVCAIDKSTLESADLLAGSDFEDNLQIACAIQYHLNAIVSRDLNDFKDVPVLTITPSTALQRIMQ